MNTRLSAVLPALLLAASAVPSLAQDVGRVSPASLPVPLPGAAAVAPDALRARNPWNLPMTGDWRFQLTHGQIDKSKQFQPSAPVRHDVTASTSQGENPPQAAFDGSPDTRWCANSADFPQWLQADLGATRRVTGATLAWENAGDTYGCRIEGRSQGGKWQTLADKTATPGVGDGPVTLTPADVRYVRITVTGTPGPHWASLREFQIQIAENGRQVAWRPPAPPTAPRPASEAARDAFASPGLDDAGWHTLPVPSNWEMAGYSIPTYDAVDNTVGLYRRYVTVPAAWAGRRVYWHFDGALDGAEVFVNGQKAGYHESGYTAWDIDLTGLVKPGRRNLFAVRVSKTTPSYDADTGDFQTMGGIYRDTSLIAVPQTHVSDITVRTPLAPNYRDATLDTQVQVMGAPGQAVAVSGSLVAADGRATGVRLSGAGQIGADGTARLSLSAPVQAPRLWSAEKPNLYYVVLELSGGGSPVERVEQRFGFRQVEVKDNVVLWNGRPIKCTGVCRHDFWSDKGFALSDKEWNTDLTMMKAANINAVRTSHYNHAARFLELCDEKGMYILDEVPYCWINDQVKDPAYAPYLLQRAQETVARDKNRACVLAYSLGNENPNGVDSQMVLDLVNKADPTRPAFVSGQDPAGIKGQLWKDDHYPGPDSIDRYARDTRWGTNLTEHPHTFYEKEAQDYDPGVSDLWSETLIKTWDKLWKAPNILGSFIWEWQSQGVADKNEDTTTDFYLGPDRLRQENNKGIVDGYRHPKPELWIVKMAYSPVVVGARGVQPSAGSCTVPLTNHYSFTDLGELSCRWTALAGRTTLQSGTENIPCGPMQTVQTPFPAPAGMTALRLEFTHPDGRMVSSANLPVDGAALAPPPAALTAGTALTAQDGPEALRVANTLQEIVFDKHAGTVRSWRVGGRSLLVGGPVVNLGEAKAGSERGYFRAAKPPFTEGAQVTAAPGADGGVRVGVTSQVRSGVDGSALGTLTCTYDVGTDAEVRVEWRLDWAAPDARLWESGLKLSVPTDLSHMSWLRDAYFADYPAGHLGEPQGTCRAGDVSFRSSKRGLHWLTLTDAGGFGVALLPQDQPLVGRADPGPVVTTLFASREVAGLRGLSGSWVDDHTIDAKKGGSLSGSFVLRAVVPPAR